MWKKLDNFASPRTDASANESLDSNLTGEDADAQDDPWQIGKSDREELEEGSPFAGMIEKPEGPKGLAEQAPPVTLGAYTEAVNKFTKSASAFIEHLPLLAEARRAYEEATRASAELRRVLDAGDENLRALMSHLEQMANVHFLGAPVGKSSSDARPPEPSKLGPVRVSEEAKGAVKRFP
ncbi:MAG TPA: hypothetical protein VF123_10995 [Candidatus Sulfotelmatobacter sp.]